ncbi:hypothetical protein BDZ88DRAFT_452482 [Geranomyces variabilis]|nr:hypothetical protein BDZ88DRAFT_452482 [Geranomyces variabilis]KAJ3133735.1 hypothetical protein HDU90_005573 [Geranomyces variabilis]
MTSANKAPEPHLYLWGLPISTPHSLLSESLHLILKHKYKRLHAVHLYHGSDRAHISYTDEDKLKQDVRAVPRSWMYDFKGTKYEITGVPKLAKIGVLAVMGVPKSKSINTTWHLPPAPWTVQTRISNDVTLVYFTEATASMLKNREKKQTITIDGVQYKINKVEMPATNGDEDTEVSSRANADTTGSASASEPTTRNGSDVDTLGAFEDAVEMADDNEELNDGMRALFDEMQDENDALRENIVRKDVQIERIKAQMERMNAQMARMDQERRETQYEASERLARKDAEIAMFHSINRELQMKVSQPPPPPPPCTKCVIWEGVTAQQADMVIGLQQELATLRTD